VVCLFKVCFSKYQQQKKLIPLLVDYAEYEEDLEEEIRERRKSNSEEAGNINSSDRGSLTI